MKTKKISEGLCICIPTCRDNIEASSLDSVMVGIANQTILPGTIYLRDEGNFECFKKSSTRMLWNLLSALGIKTIYLRSRARRGVANARKELADLIKDESYVLWLDDDMVMDYKTIEVLLDILESDPQTGFVQGQKIELNPLREYHNDINQLNGSNEDLHTVNPFPIYFGDAALLMMRCSAMKKHIDWATVTKYSMEGLAGEDVAMSLMIADKLPCLAVPKALGWHISPEKERWNWESSSDVLQIELLKGIVSDRTLELALPHLKNQFS